MKNSIFLLLVVLLNMNGIAAESYSVATIPKSLLTNANAVIRLSDETVEIVSLNKVVVREHVVITILNEAGDQFAYWVGNYSSLYSLSGLEGTLYDAAGKKIRSLKKSEIVDRPFSEFSFEVDDVRQKSHNFFHKDYPYTVEYEYEMTKSYTMFLPGWRPVYSKGLSVEQSSFTVISDKDISFRTKSYNLKKEPVETMDGKKRIRRWELSQHPAVINEYASPSVTELTPLVTLAPDEFRMGDYKGSMSTWKDFGSFIKQLTSGLDELPPATREKVRSLVQGLSTDREKVEVLYRYLQQNTHYISIQLGIGGWRPLAASYVVQKGYGDCKALTNFMMAMLKEVGIKSNYVLVKSGKYENDINVNFPASYFDHVICAVPLTTDTIWLECTSQIDDPGYMGSFTGNRHVLMITGEGGKIVRTPQYNKEVNTVHSYIAAKLDATGQVELRAENRYRACASDNLKNIIRNYSREDQQKFLKSYLDIPHYDVTEFSYKEIPGKLPVIIEQIKIAAPNYAQVTGKRLFVVPNIMNKWDNKLVGDTARMYEVVLKEEKVESDSVSIEVPAGYSIENLPKPVEIKTPFGRYQASVKWLDNKLFYIRKLELNKGRFPAKEYMNLARFYEQIYKADRAKVVLVKTE